MTTSRSGTWSSAKAPVDDTIRFSSVSMPGLGEFLRGLQQRLRRNAADVEAGPAEAGAAFDASRLEPELCRADRRDVTPRTGPDDDDVVAIGHGANDPISLLSGRKRLSAVKKHPLDAEKVGKIRGLGMMWPNSLAGEFSAGFEVCRELA